MSPGVAYNENQRVAAGITSMLMLLSTVVVGLRLYIRCVYLGGGSAGWDDVTVFISWIMALGATGATYVEIYSGLGRHMAELSHDELYHFELSLFLVIQFYNVGLNSVKISFLSQYYRIFPDKIVRKICIYYGCFCFLWMFGQAILYALSCVPLTGLVPSLASICVPTLPVWTAISSINVFTDVVIFSIPLKPLWSMPMMKRQRYLLTGIFCIGFLVCIISIIRIPTLRQGAQSPDPTFTNVTTALWSLAELQTAILCTSLPILRPMVAKFVRGIYPSEEHPPRPRDEPDRGLLAERGPARPHEPWGDSLLKTTALRGSTLKSSVQSTLKSTVQSMKSSLQSAPRTLQSMKSTLRSVPRPESPLREVDVENAEQREQENNTALQTQSQPQPSSLPETVAPGPLVVNLEAVTIVDIEDDGLNHRDNRHSSTMVMRGSITTGHCTAHHNISTPSLVSGISGAPEPPRSAACAPPPLVIKKRNRYSAQWNSALPKFIPQDLREIPSPPGLAITCQQLPSKCSCVTQAMFQSHSTQTTDSLFDVPRIPGLGTPATTPATSMREIHKKRYSSQAFANSASIDLDTISYLTQGMGDEDEEVIRDDAGSDLQEEEDDDDDDDESLPSHEDYGVKETTPIEEEAEVEEDDEIEEELVNNETKFGFTKIPIARATSFQPPITSWLRLTPEPDLGSDTDT